MTPKKTKKNIFTILRIRILGNKAKVLRWGLLWLVILCSPVIIDQIFSKCIWEKDLNNIMLSCDILRDTQNVKREIVNILSGNEISLKEISGYLDKELEAGRGLEKYNKHFKQGDILNYKYQEQGNSNWIRLLILLFPPLLFLGASNHLRNIWKQSFLLLNYDPLLARMLKYHNDWFEQFGLSRINIKRTRRRYYYHTLEIMAAGYKQIYGTDKQDKIFLFWRGDLTHIKSLATEYKSKAELQKLFSLLNKLAKKDPHGEKNAIFQIKRGLICTKNEFDMSMEEAGDWHAENYPNIENVFIDIEDGNISDCVKDLNNECDFAVFENADGANHLFIGFYANCATFVLQDRLDKLGDREELFTLARDYFK